MYSFPVKITPGRVTDDTECRIYDFGPEEKDFRFASRNRYTSLTETVCKIALWSVIVVIMIFWTVNALKLGVMEQSMERWDEPVNQNLMLWYNKVLHGQIYRLWTYPLVQDVPFEGTTNYWLFVPLVMALANRMGYKNTSIALAALPPVCGIFAIMMSPLTGFRVSISCSEIIYGMIFALIGWDTAYNKWEDRKAAKKRIMLPVIVIALHYILIGIGATVAGQGALYLRALILPTGGIEDHSLLKAGILFGFLVGRELHIHENIKLYGFAKPWKMAFNSAYAVSQGVQRNIMTYSELKPHFHNIDKSHTGQEFLVTDFRNGEMP